MARRRKLPKDLSDQEKAKILELFNSGLPIMTIRPIIGRHHLVIKQFLVSQGVWEDRRGNKPKTPFNGKLEMALTEPLSLKEIGQHFNKTPQAIYFYLRRRNLRRQKQPDGSYTLVTRDPNFTGFPDAAKVAS